jgi:hypothetical protein
MTDKKDDKKTTGETIIEKADEVLSGALADMGEFAGNIDEHVRDLHDEFVRRVAMIAIAAVGLITALAWDDFLQELFKAIFSEGMTLGVRFLYAIALTMIAASFAIAVRKLVPWYNKIWEKKKKKAERIKNAAKKTADKKTTKKVVKK